MTWDAWWQQFWVQALGGAAGALIFAALVSALSKNVRDKFWKPIGRWITRIATVRIRLTTTGRERRSAAEREAAEQETRRSHTAAIEAVEGERDQAVASEAAARQELADAKAKAEQDAEWFTQLRTNQVAEARAQGRSEGIVTARAEAEAEAEARRAAPAERPVWRVVEVAAGTFELRDVQGVAGIRNVGIDASLSEFEFHGPTQQRGEFAGVLAFVGNRMSGGERFGVDFDVAWQDEHGEPWTGAAHLDKNPRVAWDGI